MDKETFLIVGLGNPGTQYVHTRHNVGFDVLEKLCRHLGVTPNREKLHGLLCETTIDDKRVVICMPQTFMNVSGVCVAELLAWYKTPLDHLIVIYDDIDLPSGKVRVRKSGSAGTHNGMRSILANTPSDQFPRIRVGTGSKPEGWDLANWVLSRYMTREEQDCMDHAFGLAAECAEDWVKNGIDHAMQYNNRK